MAGIKIEIKQSGIFHCCNPSLLHRFGSLHPYFNKLFLLIRIFYEFPPFEFVTFQFSHILKIFAQLSYFERCVTVRHPLETNGLQVCKLVRYPFKKSQQLDIRIANILEIEREPSQGRNIHQPRKFSF